MLEYQQPDSRLTLESGRAEYYANNSGLVDGRSVSPMAKEFFRCHDTAHVVFGCSTALLNESMVKLWSFFGTTRGLRLLREYRLPESQEIYEQLEWDLIARTAVRSITVAPRVIVRCTCMNKRWPWSEYDQFEKVSLAELRDEFGIEVLVVE